jgi:hypothetical protein
MLCPVLWCSRPAFVSIMRGARTPVTKGALDERKGVAWLEWDYAGPSDDGLPSSGSLPTGDIWTAGWLPLTMQQPPSSRTTHVGSENRNRALGGIGGSKNSLAGLHRHDFNRAD